MNSFSAAAGINLAGTRPPTAGVPSARTQARPGLPGLCRWCWGAVARAVVLIVVAVPASCVAAGRKSMCTARPSPTLVPHCCARFRDLAGTFQSPSQWADARDAQRRRTRARTLPWDALLFARPPLTVARLLRVPMPSASAAREACTHARTRAQCRSPGQYHAMPCLIAYVPRYALTAGPGSKSLTSRPKTT